MIQMFRSLAATLLLGVALSTGTNAVAQTDKATAEVLMRESGLWKQLESLAPQTRAGIQSALSQGGSSISQKDAERIAGLAEEAFAVTRLRAVAQSVVAKRTKQAHVPALLSWYRSPLGASLTQLEEEATANDTREPEVAMQEDSALLATLPAKRQNLLKQFVQVIRAGEAMTTIAINSAVAIQVGAASAMPNSPARSSAELRRSLDRERPEMIKAMNSFAVAVNARVYASVSDADLAKYIAFLKSPAGAHFMDSTVQALDAALVDAATELGRSIPTAKGRTQT